MNTGYIKLHRKMKDWGWYKNANVMRLFMHLLLSANHECGEWCGTTIKPGQLITGLLSLHKELGISVQSIRTSLTKLKSTNEITVESTNKFSLITIVKWQEYQYPSTSTTTGNLTNNQQTTNKQLTTNKNNKNEDNEKKENQNFSKPNPFIVSGKPKPWEKQPLIAPKPLGDMSDEEITSFVFNNL